MATNYILNWKPGEKDPRDYKYSSIMPKRAALPTSASVRSIIPEVYDQGSIGSCTANAGAMIALHRSRTQSRQIFGSRLQMYYDAREIIGEIGIDGGAYIRDVYKAMTHKGIAPESAWPYIESKFTVKPGDDVYNLAAKTKAEGYHAVARDLNELKTCLANGNPIQFGFIVYESFVSGNWRSVMPHPAHNESVIGGHSMILIGYDDNIKAFEAKNSWGSGWKDGGHLWIAYDLVTSDMFDDFYMLEKLTPLEAPAPGDGKIDPKKVFLKAADISRLNESTMLRLGAEMHLQVDAKKSKSWNCKLIASALGL